jgi:hypothetical protein
MIQGKNKILFLNMLLIFSFLTLAPICSAGNNQRNQTINDPTKLIGSSIEERLDALTEINDNSELPLSKETVEQILILAEKEQKEKESTTKGELGELYYSAIIDALGNTRDSRAVPFLAGYFFDSGTAVSKSLRKIGPAAIDPLIAKLHDDVVGFRASAANALGFLLKPDDSEYVATNELREKIKKVLIQELKESRNQNPDKGIPWYEIRAQERAQVRLFIIRGLSYLANAGDKEALALIKAVAKEDAYYIDMRTKKNYSGPQKIYLVRDEAQIIIDGLKKSGQNK